MSLAKLTPEEIRLANKLDTVAWSLLASLSQIKYPCLYEDKLIMLQRIKTFFVKQTNERILNVPKNTDDSNLG